MNTKLSPLIFLSLGLFCGASSAADPVSGTLNCSPSAGAAQRPAWQMPVSIEVNGREATWNRNYESTRESLRGRIEGNSVHFAGLGGTLKESTRLMNYEWKADMTVRLSADELKGQGALFTKDGSVEQWRCTVSFSGKESQKFAASIGHAVTAAASGPSHAASLAPTAAVPAVPVPQVSLPAPLATPAEAPLPAPQTPPVAAASLSDAERRIAALEKSLAELKAAKAAAVTTSTNTATPPERPKAIASQGKPSIDTPAAPTAGSISPSPAAEVQTASAKPISPPAPAQIPAPAAPTPAIAAKPAVTATVTPSPPAPPATPALKTPDEWPSRTRFGIGNFNVGDAGSICPAGTDKFLKTGPVPPGWFECSAQVKTALGFQLESIGMSYWEGRNNGVAARFSGLSDADRKLIVRRLTEAFGNPESTDVGYYWIDGNKQVGFNGSRLEFLDRPAARAMAAWEESRKGVRPIPATTQPSQVQSASTTPKLKQLGPGEMLPPAVRDAANQRVATYCAAARAVVESLMQSAANLKLQGGGNQFGSEIDQASKNYAKCQVDNMREVASLAGYTF